MKKGVKKGWRGEREKCNGVSVSYSGEKERERAKEQERESRICCFFDFNQKQRRSAVEKA